MPRIKQLAIFILTLSLIPLGRAQAADQVLRLRVTAPGVEVRRGNTIGWIPVKIESLVGVGDSIRTTEKGQAALTSGDGVVTIKLSPASEIAVISYAGTSDQFDLRIEIHAGLTNYAAAHPLSDKIHFTFATAAFEERLISGETMVRLEPDGRTAALVTATGQTTIAGSTQLTLHTGIRAAPGMPLSDVVPAINFATLDSALDGCPSVLTLDGDVQINVRAGAALTFARIGGLGTATPVQALGITKTGDWYRVRYQNGYGWIAVKKLPLTAQCAGLRIFPDKYGPEADAPPLTFF